MELMNEAAIAEQLCDVTGWKVDDNAIVRTFTLSSFAAAIDFVRRVAALADAAGQHPDILIRYNRVTLTLSTHEAGGVTMRDIDLARCHTRCHYGPS